MTLSVQPRINETIRQLEFSVEADATTNTDDVLESYLLDSVRVTGIVPAPGAAGFVLAGAALAARRRRR